MTGNVSMKVSELLMERYARALLGAPGRYARERDSSDSEYNYTFDTIGYRTSRGGEVTVTCGEVLSDEDNYTNTNHESPKSRRRVY